jgi:hypothetical protein
VRTVAIQLTAFDPARHGFAFANSFTTTVFPAVTVPLLGTFGPFSVGGLCAGMAASALDYFFSGKMTPTHQTGDYPGGVPPVGDPLHQWIYARHLNCYGFEPSGTLLPSGDPVPSPTADFDRLKNGLRFIQNPAPTAAGLTAELAVVKASITAGNPVLLGMVSPGATLDGHVLVAVGFDDTTPGTTSLFAYDCNHPGATCTLRVEPASLKCEEDVPGATKTWRNFLAMSYARKTPSYIDLALSGGLTAVPSLPDGRRAFRFQFAVKNQGVKPAHASALDLGIDKALPAGASLPFEDVSAAPVAPGAAVNYNIAFNFPQELAGEAVVVTAMLTNAFGRLSAVQVGTTGGVTQSQTVTVPLEFD